MPSVAAPEQPTVSPGSEQVGAGATIGRPVLPPQPPESADGREALRAVRTFAMTGTDVSGRLQSPGKGVLPALMHTLRQPERVRTGEPIVLLADDARDPVVRTFADWLAAHAQSIFPGADAARILRDNLARLERAARDLAGAEGRPASLAELLVAAGDAVIGQTQLREAPAQALRADIARLTEPLTADDTFVSLTGDAPLAIMVHLARRLCRAQRTRLATRVRDLRDRLDHRLAVEGGRGGQRTAEAFADASSPGAALDPAALARVLGKARGPRGMPEERRRRLQGLRDQLDAYLADAGEPCVIVVQPRGGAPSGASDWSDVEVVSAELPCDEAARRFDALADRRLPLFLAVRVAELELDDRYDPAVHGLYIEAFDRAGLSPEEVGALPAVIAIETLASVTGPDMPNLSRVLLSGRPIRVLLETDPASNMLPMAEHEPLIGARFEPGLFAIGLREALVHQSTVSAPGHMADGFQRALATDRASFHIVAPGTCAGGVEPTVGRWLHAGAAAEARAHPLFLYDPSRGASWADRFDFEGNEQPERDWPEHQLDCQDSGGAQRTLPQSFTFADYAILEPAYREHYRLIPEDCPTGDLATIAEYLADERDADRRIPYVWVAGPDGAMRRAAIARRLTTACRDRLSCWRTLQQCAGIHDVYAERAVASERQRAAEDADARIAQLKAEHAAEIDRIRREEAGAALGKLAQSILGVDLSNLTAAPARAPTRPAPAPPKETDQAAPATEETPAAEAEEEDLGFDEPYIDSPLCTTCNDCTNLNPRMFKYNENKQAVIADPDAGTYAELVHAAEKCPARCIHPGKPRNPNEPGLDDLIKRAKPFN